MTATGPIDTIQWDRDFKVLCDGLLRFELGRLAQTFGSDGSDGGVDAEFNGPIDGTSGRWVFQYKFRSPKDALPNRRSWLTHRYLGSKSRPSEFDKDGVKSADGYVLMTNVPVTPAIVEKLKKEWRKRKHKGPFCVWDPSRLNALLKGREHLARSWTGAKEARCHREIILPLWQWLEAALASTSKWKHDPLWPLEVRSYHEVFPVAAFHRSFAGRDGLTIAPRMGVLNTVLLDPQFEYAATVVYPHAMDPFGAVRKAVSDLARAVVGHVDDLCPELERRLPQLQQLGDDRAEATRILAYCVLENRWGFPMRGLHSIKDGKLVVQDRYDAWDKPALTDLEPTLDALVGEVTRGIVGKEVETARNEVSRLVRRWWGRMWHVVSFGIDPEVVNETAE